METIEEKQKIANSLNSMLRMLGGEIKGDAPHHSPLL